MTLHIRWLGMVAVALWMGCGEGSLSVESAETLGTASTWEAFLEQTYQEPLTGVYIVDGDTPIEDVKQLREFYSLYVESGGLAVHSPRGVDARWDNTQKRQLRYCVSTSFGTRYNAAVQAMQTATAAWEAVANVDFIHATELDTGCTARTSNVLFDVNPVSARGMYLARAFFPGQSRSTRNVLIDESAFRSTSPSLTGILRHELGHVLGFRHEHTRPEAGTCFEDSSWRAVTPYDSRSVMHYPQCNGRGGWQLELSPLDAQGAAALYGAPGGDNNAPAPAPSSPRTETLTGMLARGQARSFGPIDVVGGELVDVTLTGTGDPDLYVSFGAPPTGSSFACRPYLSGAQERCRLNAPNETPAQLYITVVGFTAASFRVDATFRAP